MPSPEGTDKPVFGARAGSAAKLLAGEGLGGTGWPCSPCRSQSGHGRDTHRWSHQAGTPDGSGSPQDAGVGGREVLEEMALPFLRPFPRASAPAECQAGQQVAGTRR